MFELLAKNGKVVALVVLFCAAGGVGYFNGCEKPPLPTHLTLACTETGEIFSLHRDRVRPLPGPNPKTGRHTLVPVHKDPNSGEYMMSERHSPLLTDIGDMNHYVDPKTLVVRKP